MSIIKLIANLCLSGAIVGGIYKFFNNNPTNNETILLMIIFAIAMLSELKNEKI